MLRDATPLWQTRTYCVRCIYYSIGKINGCRFFTNSIFIIFLLDFIEALQISFFFSFSFCCGYIYFFLLFVCGTYLNSKYIRICFVINFCLYGTNLQIFVIISFRVIYMYTSYNFAKNHTCYQITDYV